MSISFSKTLDQIFEVWNHTYQVFENPALIWFSIKEPDGTTKS